MPLFASAFLSATIMRLQFGSLFSTSEPIVENGEVQSLQRSLRDQTLLNDTTSSQQDGVQNDSGHSPSIDTMVERSKTVTNSDSTAVVKDMQPQDKRENRDSVNQDAGVRTRHARDHSGDRRTKINMLESEKGCVQRELEFCKTKRREMSDEVWGLQRENADLRRELESARQREAEIASYHGRQLHDLHAIEDQLRRMEAQHEITRYQLKEKTTELQSAQLFINQADALSGAEVIAMANALNAEILQSAAFMADSLDYTRLQPQKLEEVSRERLMVGEELMQALISRNVQGGHEFDPTLVQLALQVCLVRCCTTIIKSWTLTGDDGILKDVYMNIVEKDKQSAAGRWRAMTQSYATSKNGDTRCLKWITKRIVDVLLLVGCSKQETKTFLDSFRERLSVMNSLTLRLRTAIGEQVTSVDIIPTIVKSGSAFNSDAMDNSYAEEKLGGHDGKDQIGAGEPVAGSTELGLISRVNLRGKIQDSIILKPKVILCSALNEDS